MNSISRRNMLQAAAGAFLWPELSLPESLPLMEPAGLAQAIEQGTAPVVLFVGFPVLYRQKHIPKAAMAGPASKPEGLARIREAIAQLPKDKPLLLYCGCCPMDHCPNVHPAYSLLVEHGFRAVRVLNLPTNFHTDWAAKDYPVEKS